jgi:hypothetical protein
LEKERRKKRDGGRLYLYWRQDEEEGLAGIRGKSTADATKGHCSQKGACREASPID